MSDVTSEQTSPPAPATPSKRVDTYLQHSKLWPAEVARLRQVLLATGLSEDLKWGKPCYAHDGHNVVIVQEFKPHLALMFFKGALMADPAGVLEEQGENSRAAMRMTFTSVEDVDRLTPTIREYVAEAVAVEESGAKLPPPKPIVLTDVLAARIDSDDQFKEAFEGLTRGCQREYNLYFGDAKKFETRQARLDRYAEQILAGRAMRDR